MGIIRCSGEFYSGLELRGLSGFSGFPGINSSSEPSPGTSFCRSFWVFCVLFCCLDISGSHFSTLPYMVVFCYMVRQIFLFLFLEYTENGFVVFYLWPNKISCQLPWDIFCFIVPFTMLFATVLSVAISVGGCRWPISARDVFLVEVARWNFSKQTSQLCFRWPMP